MAGVTEAMSVNFTNASNQHSVIIDCGDYIPKAQDLFRTHTLANVIFLAVAGSLMLITLSIFVEEVSFITKHFELNRRKVLTVWVLAIYPVFSVAATLGLFVPRAGTIVDLVSNVYFSTCLYQFVRLMISYLGGKERMWAKLGDTKVSLRGPPCCCCCFCLPEVQFSNKTVTVIKFLVMQVTIIRPILTFLSAVMWANGSYVPGLEILKDHRNLDLAGDNYKAILAFYCCSHVGQWLLHSWTAEWLAFQVTMVRPFLHFLAAVLWANGSYVPGLISWDNGYVYIAVMNLISTFTAVYGLLLLQKVFKPVLPSYHLGGKFLSIQSVLLLTVIPNIIINILVTNGVIPCTESLPSKVRGERIYHGFVVCLMLPLSLLGRGFYRRRHEGKHDRDENMNGLEPLTRPTKSVETQDKEIMTSKLSIV